MSPAVVVRGMRCVKVVGGSYWPAMAEQNETVARALGNDCMPPLEVHQKYTNPGHRMFCSYEDISLVVSKGFAQGGFARSWDLEAKGL